MHKLYQITNLVNGKLYIGITKLSLETRWAKHLKDSLDPKYPIHRAIKKYGAENFTITVLRQDEDRKVISESEEPTILQLNTRVNGYNVAKGGYGGDLGPEANRKRSVTRQEWSSEKKKHYSELQRKRQLGRKYSEETKQKMSSLQKDRGGYGPKEHSISTKTKLSAANTGKVRTQDTRQKMSTNAIINHISTRFNGRRATCLCCHKEWDIGNYTQHINKEIK